MGILDALFGERNNEIKEVLAQGAVIIDVRTAQEFRGGKVNGSINIPVDQISDKLVQIKKYKKPLVLCCASGMRSASAMATLRNAGIENVYNARTWTKVSRLLNQ